VAELGFETFGEGPCRVLALPGWFADERAFQPITRAISPHEFTIVTVAYRGYGASRHLTGDYTVEEIAADCLELADNLGWRRFSLIGHSMGGCAAQRILADAADRVEKLVGITSVPASGFPFSEERHHWFLERAADLGKAKELVQYSVGTRISPSFVDLIYRNLLEITTADAFAGYFRSWSRADFHKEIVGKALPVLVLTAEFEHAMTPELLTETYLTYYPNARMEVLPSAGHYSIDEIPLLLGTMIEAFLRI
jgi:pimeloyl-ACP methyl ester carboxylesterase